MILLKKSSYWSPCYNRYSNPGTINSLTTYGTHTTPHLGSAGNQQARENPPKQISAPTQQVVASLYSHPRQQTLPSVCRRLHYP
jgi:hypothetical protein